MKHYTQLQIDFSWDENDDSIYDEDLLMDRIDKALSDQGLVMIGYIFEGMDHAYTEEVRK